MPVNTPCNTLAHGLCILPGMGRPIDTALLLAERMGWNQSDLARRLGIRPQVITNWKERGMPPKEHAAVADVLGVTVDTLLGRDTNLTKVQSLDTAQAATLVHASGAPDGGNVRADDTRRDAAVVREDGNNFHLASYASGRLPVVSWVQAGQWSDVSDNFQPGDADEWVDSPFRQGPRSFVLRVVGDSMRDDSGPLSFHEGDFIAVDPDREALHRSMVVIRLDDEAQATFKQLLIEPDGTRLLRALNPSWPNRIIPVTERATICGVVIGKWTPIA